MAIFLTLVAICAQTIANYELREQRYPRGVGLLTAHFFLWCQALRLAPLTQLVPWTALAHVFNAFLARRLLGERVTARRWAGTLMITLGIGLCS